MRQCTSGRVTGHFLAPTVSIKMAIKHQRSHIKTSSMQESKHAMAIGCKMTKVNSQMQDEAATLAAGHPRRRRIFSGFMKCRYPIVDLREPSFCSPSSPLMWYARPHGQNKQLDFESPKTSRRNLKLSNFNFPSSLTIAHISGWRNKRTRFKIQLLHDIWIMRPSPARLA